MSEVVDISNANSRPSNATTHTNNPLIRESLQIDNSATSNEHTTNSNNNKSINKMRGSEQPRGSNTNRWFSSFSGNRNSNALDLENGVTNPDEDANEPEDRDLIATISEFSDISESFVSTMGSLSISSRMSIMGMVQRRQNKVFFESMDRFAGIRLLLCVLGLLPHDRQRSPCFNILLKLYYYALRLFLVGIYLPYTIYLWTRYNINHSAYDENDFVDFTYVVNNYIFTSNFLQIFLGIMLWWQMHDRIMVRACSTLDVLIASKMVAPTSLYFLFICAVTVIVYPVGAHLAGYVSALNTAKNNTENQTNHDLSGWYTLIEIIGQVIIGQILAGMFLFFFTDTNITLMLLEETTELIVHEKLSVPTTMLMKQEIHARNHFNHMGNPYTNDLNLQTNATTPRHNSQNSQIPVVKPSQMRATMGGAIQQTLRHSQLPLPQTKASVSYPYDDRDTYREHHFCVQVLLGNGYTTVSALCLCCTVGFVLRLYVHEGALGALFLACLLFFKEIPLFVVVLWRAMKINERSNWMMRLLGENIWEENMELTRSLVFMNMASYPISFKILGYRIGYRGMFYPLVALMVTILAGFIRILAETS